MFAVSVESVNLENSLIQDLHTLLGFPRASCTSRRFLNMVVSSFLSSAVSSLYKADSGTNASIYQQRSVKHVVMCNSQREIPWAAYCGRLVVFSFCKGELTLWRKKDFNVSYLTCLSNSSDSPGLFLYWKWLSIDWSFTLVFISCCAILVDQIETGKGRARLFAPPPVRSSVVTVE